MQNTIKNLEHHIEQISDYVNLTSEDKMSKKSNPGKWSKKEILGHLVDSGINNLQRFTEIQFKEKPYKIRPYNQEELVSANNYQAAETKDILDLLIAINRRIIAIIKLQTTQTLKYSITTSDNLQFDLQYLMEDYVSHFKHHTRQIIE